MLITVPGHIELNIVRLLLKFLWTLVKKLGFQIDKGQLFVKNGIDHHCTCQILSCSLLLLSAELLWSYVHECQQKQILPTNEDTCSQQYLFAYHITFSFHLAFHLYTEATGKNELLRMLAACIQFLPLLYSFKHSKYWKLHLRNLCQRAHMPDMLKVYIELHESICLYVLIMSRTRCSFTN